MGNGPCKDYDSNHDKEGRCRCRQCLKYEYYGTFQVDKRGVVLLFSNTGRGNGTFTYTQHEGTVVSESQKRELKAGLADAGLSASFSESSLLNETQTASQTTTGTETISPDSPPIFICQHYVVMRKGANESATLWGAIVRSETSSESSSSGMRPQPPS